MTLYSYCLRYDNGAAPNPYHGVCTLVICKPAIRRVAEPGDWIVGFGGAHSPIGDISGQVVYAMRVTKRVTMRQYDKFCRDRFRAKIPKWRSGDFIKRVGDCIYDYSRAHEPQLRTSIHGEQNRQVDLSGKNALLSKHFYYFGDHPLRLPARLRPIVHQTQGHKSHANDGYTAKFLNWIEGLGLTPNGLYGEPQFMPELMAESGVGARCSRRDLEEDESDDSH